MPSLKPGYTNAVGFISNLKRYHGERLPAIARAASQEFAVALGRGVIGRNPVRTGRSKGNWRLSVGVNPPTLGYDPFGFDPSGLVTMTRLEYAAQRIAAYSSWTLYNNVPYVKYLERGSSTQAPMGMMRVTLQELKTNFAARRRAIIGRLGGRFIVR